jgi:hypothetical protein
VVVPAAEGGEEEVPLHLLVVRPSENSTFTPYALGSSNIGPDSLSFFPLHALAMPNPAWARSQVA